MKEFREIEKSLIRNTLAWDNLKDKVEIKKGPFRGFSIYYNDWYIGGASSLSEIHRILNLINQMVYAMK